MTKASQSRLQAQQIKKATDTLMNMRVEQLEARMERAEKVLQVVVASTAAMLGKLDATTKAKLDALGGTTGARLGGTGEQ